jgi:hypothetical protein
MNREIVYAVRWQNLWWCGSAFMVDNPEKTEQLGSPFLKDATFFSDDVLAEDLAKQLGGQMKRVDLVTE